MSYNLGTLTSWNHLDHSRPVTGLLYLSLYLTEYVLELEKFLTKSYREIKTHISPKNCAIYDIMWKNIVQPGRAYMKKLYEACASHARSIRLWKIQSEYVILIAFPWQ